jgi:hypothetical protein
MTNLYEREGARRLAASARNGMEVRSLRVGPLPEGDWKITNLKCEAFCIGVYLAPLQTRRLAGRRVGGHKRDTSGRSNTPMPVSWIAKAPSH